jgi:glycosyltransferase involved in cell wall biosynthesis
MNEAKQFWQEHGVAKRDQVFIACYFGALGPQCEIDTVLQAADLLSRAGQTFKFVICGKGEYYEKFRKAAGRLRNAVFPGWVGANEIWELMRIADVGLAPIKSNKNYVGNIPNKIGEYLSAGLPIVSSMRGTVERLLAAQECGVTYENANPKSLAASLVALHGDRTRLTQMSQNAKDLYEAKFAAEKVYAGMADHLEGIAKAFHR